MKRVQRVGRYYISVKFTPSQIFETTVSTNAVLVLPCVPSRPQVRLPKIGRIIKLKKIEIVS